MQDKRLLLCTDLDRTLLPNGRAAEHAGARELFKTLVERPEVTLAFVSGRDRRLVLAAIDHWQLPRPDWVIGDVGTTLWEIGRDGQWQLDDHWSKTIAVDWAGCDHGTLAGHLSGFDGLELQPAERQNPYKLSYFTASGVDIKILLGRLAAKLDGLNVRARLVFSEDETTGQGLLDVLPAAAAKLNAILSLMQSLDMTIDQTVFCGDSGNDLDVLASSVPAVLVANATPAVRAEARALAAAAGNSSALYLASGGYRGMNGCYAAGIVEGVVHYHRHVDAWLAVA